MKRLTYVELDIEVCSLEYGVSPCAASLTSPATGTRKCTNCKNTCQDTENYAPETVTLRFSVDNGLMPREIEAIASIAGVSYSPALISLGEDLGQRASLSVTFKDHRHSDTGLGFDKYVSERDYNPFEQGTFWGRFRARQPYIKGQAIRLIRGFVPESIETVHLQGTPLPDGVLDRQDVRHFYVESFDGPTTTGSFTISAKDVLKFLDGDRAQAPRLNVGRLLNDLTDSATTATLTPTGIGNEEYETEGYLNFGGAEIVHFSRDPYSGLNAQTQLLFHFDGANNSTTITDSSGKGRNGTCVGTAKLSTSEQRYGSACAIFDGSGHITVPDNAAWTFGADFTIDAWVKVTSLSINRCIISHGTDGTNLWDLSVLNDGSVGWRVVSGGTVLAGTATGPGLIELNQLYHIAWERKGTRFRIYIDGVVAKEITSSVTIPNYTNSLRIGITGDGVGLAFVGRIDELRIQSEAFFDGDFSDALPGPYAANGETLVIQRAQKGTTAKAHQAQDRVQNILTYEAEDVADVIFDLMTEYGEVDEELIRLDQWQAETSVYLQKLLTADIAEPTSVNKLISEIIKQFGLCIYWDEQSQTIVLRVLRAVTSEAPLYDEKVYLQDTLKTREQPEKRLSQAYTYYGKRNPLAGEDDPDNYRSAVLTVDLEAEENYGSAAIDKVFSRWIPPGGRAVAESVNEVRLSRLRIPPRKFSLELFGTISEVPVPAGVFRTTHSSMQNDIGEQEIAPAQITRLEPTETSFRIEAEEMLGGAEALDLTDRRIYIEDDVYNVNLRTLHDQIYPAPSDQDVIDGVKLTLRILDEASVGSKSVSLPALDIGDWPDGFEITIEHLTETGRIQGKGGRGGDGAWSGTYGSPANNGENGSAALYTRHPITLKLGASSKIWSGAGGGGGGGAGLYSASHIGAPAGAGAGLDPGVGGSLPNPTTVTPATPDTGGLPGTPIGWGHYGGKGGEPGENGTPGNQNAGGVPAGLAGLAGASIDGISFVTILDGPGDLRGPQIN